MPSALPIPNLVTTFRRIVLGNIKLLPQLARLLTRPTWLGEVHIEFAELLKRSTKWSSILLTANPTTTRPRGQQKTPSDPPAKIHSGIPLVELYDAGATDEYYIHRYIDIHAANEAIY